MRDDFKRKALEDIVNRWWHCPYDQPPRGDRQRIRRETRHRMKQQDRRELAREQ